MKKRVVLGLIVLVASFGAALLQRRRRIQIIDTTAPDPFGAAVVRENLSA